MRILFVTNHKYLPERHSGMEVTTHELSLALRSRQVEVGVLCGLAGVGMVGLKGRLQIKLWNNPCPRDYSLGYPIWRSWNAVPSVGRVADGFQPDIIIVEGGDKFEALVMASLELARPVLCYLHTADRCPLDQRTMADRHLFFAANSEFTKSIHSEKHVAAIVRPLVYRQRYQAETDRTTAVFVNPAPYKGLEIALRLALARPDVKFLFVRVQRRSRTARLERDVARFRNVEFAGPFSDMRKVYRNAKLVIVPSLCLETWGRVASEAHINGIPVLASDRGGLPEAVGPGGICLPADASPPQWTEAFGSIWDDRESYTRLSREASSYSRRSEIDPDRIVTAFLDLVRFVGADKHRERQG